ncbi:MAG: nucleotide sugar dehydrogenase [Bacteroidaceae bacterium]|nr:nucleotide sugar dehydrogenase [Bacteroidaceae bacterium]
MDYTKFNKTVRDILLKKITDREIVAGVIGLGYVGLPLAVKIAKAGFKTIGFDIKKEKAGSINQGRNYIGDVADSDLRTLVENGMLAATTDFGEIDKVDFVAICVPTPLDAHRQPDISYVELSVKSIAEHLHKGMMVVLESTSYPGTTEELVKPLLEASGLECGKDFYLGFSPERVNPGSATYPPNMQKVVGGIGADAGELISAMYEAVLGSKVFRTTSPAVAEMTKMLENSYRNVNIGLINEFAILCNKMGIDVWEVIEAAKTKPFGFAPFYPGPGVGGHCIPIDPCYLNHKANTYDFRFSTIEASTGINNYMPEYCVERIGEMLNRRFHKSLDGSRILILGVTYKQDIDDYRESPAISIIDKLHTEGAETAFFDPYVHKILHQGKVYEGEKELTAELIQSVDMVVITTAHSSMDYGFVQRHAKAVFDTRNATRDLADKSNIELL